MLDIVIHRFLEVPMNSVNKTLEVILDHLGCLYKFHGKQQALNLVKEKISPTIKVSNNIFLIHLDRPVTYLYNTLHFYERKLRDRPPLKKLLVS